MNSPKNLRIEFRQFALVGRAPVGTREGFILRLVGEGIEGFGEASPLPGWSAESLEEVAESLERLRHSGLPSSPEQTASLPPSVRFGLECALADIDRWNDFIPLVGRLPVGALLIGSAMDILQMGGAAYAEGCRTMKIKTAGLSCGELVNVVKELAGCCPCAVFRIDPNRSLEVPEALRLARDLGGLPVEYLEEPLREPGKLPSLISESPTPVALDETLREISPESLCKFRGAGALVLKPMLMGGLTVCRRFAREGQKLGMAPVVSSAFESGVGVHALVRLAAALPGSLAPGLDPYSFLTGDTLARRLDFSGWEVNPSAPRPPLRGHPAGCAP